ncbi:phage holin family protein [bacterium]|nr:MAG: phage holin family protein [bacterium]
MLGFLIRLAVSTATLLFMAGASNGQIVVKSTGAAIISALILGLVNALVKPILEFILGALTLPLSCLTLGLWSLVLSALINGFLFYAVANVIQGFGVQSFGVAIVASIVLSIVNSIATGLTKNDGNARANRR